MDGISLVGLPIAVPFMAAAFTLVVRNRVMVRRAVALCASAAVVVFSGALLVHVDRSGPQVMEVGGWDAAIGIVLVADLFAVLILCVASLVVFATHLHAVLTPSLEDDWVHYHAAHLALGGGVALSLLTGDLFTLFVGFEVSLVASYVLLLGRRGRDHLRDSTTYVVANLVVSTLFLIAVAGVYAAAGTVNLADLAMRWDGMDTAVRGALGGLLVVVFATKAAAFPLFGWLPEAYAKASIPVAAVLAGLLTKLGVYALVRTQTLLGIVPDGATWLLGAVAAGSMLVGVVGALAQTDVRRILAFHIVSQIGYMLFGLALVSEAGLAGTVFYVVHHILVKSALFLVAGSIEAHGADGLRHRGMGRAAPWLAALFAVPALSLAGIPPLSGFTAKLVLLDAGLAEGAIVLVGVGTVTSLLTILSMAKIWSGVFWGDGAGPDPANRLQDGRTPTGDGIVVGRAGAAVVARQGLGAGVLAVGTIGVSLGAAPILERAVTAASQLLVPTEYLTRVLQ